MTKRWLIPVLIVVVAMPAAVQTVPAPVPPQSVAPPPEADPAALQLAAMQQQLLAARQEIARLQAENENQRSQLPLLAQARAKNARLVAIGNELIAAYAKRYARGHFLPFDLGRRKFEAELQDAGDRLYDNRIDAGPRAPAAPATTTTPSNEK